MKAKLFLFALVFCFIPNFVHAELTLDALAAQCEGRSPKPSEPTLGILMCVSYIGGALDQIILSDGLAVRSGEQKERSICGSDQGKLEKLSDMVKFVANEHPERRNMPARAVLRGLIVNEFACN